MDEIEMYENTYRSKEFEDNKKKCHMNLIRRVRALNNFYFKEKSDELFENWKVIDSHKIIEKNICLCGAKLTLEVFLIERNHVTCYIGSSCINNFNNLKTQMNIISRKTYDCITCKKRHTKNKPCYTHLFLFIQRHLDNVKNSESLRRVISCDYCKYLFPPEKIFDYNLGVYEKVLCNYCSDKFDKKIIYLKKDGNFYIRIYSCKICKYELEYKNDLCNYCYCVYCKKPNTVCGCSTCKDCGMTLDAKWKKQCGRCWYKSKEN